MITNGELPKTSIQLIAAAVREGRAVARLADGDVHILSPAELSQHMFPDIICRDCHTVFDSQGPAWLNGQNRVPIIERRDQWRFGFCPQHS